MRSLMSHREPVAVAQRPWRTAFLAGMASFLDSAGLVSSGTAVSVLYAPSFHLTPTFIGLILATQQLCFGIGAAFGGRLGDRLGRRRILTVALLVFAAGALVMAVASAAWMLIVGAVLAGLGVGSDLPVALAMANEAAPRMKKGGAVVLSSLLWTLGIAAVQLVVSFVGHMGATGGRILFGGLVGVAIIVVLLRFALPESPEWLAARRAESEAHDLGAPPRVQYVHLVQIFKKPVVWAVLAMLLFYASWNVGASINGKYGGYIWTKLAGGDIEVFSRWSLLALPITFGLSIVFLFAVDSRARSVFNAVGAVLIVLGWAPLALFGASQAAMLAVVFLFGIGSCFAGEAQFKVWAQELIPTLVRGTSQGFIIFVARVIAAVLALITPPLLAVTPRVVFIGIFAFAILSGLVWLLWMRRLPRAEEIEEPTLVIVDEKAAITGGTA